MALISASWLYMALCFTQWVTIFLHISKFVKKIKGNWGKINKIITVILTHAWVLSGGGGGVQKICLVTPPPQKKNNKKKKKFNCACSLSVLLSVNFHKMHDLKENDMWCLPGLNLRSFLCDWQIRLISNWY